MLPVTNGGRAIPAVRLSDHSPFWDAGDDAVMVTDTSFLRNPHDHRMSDTIDTLDQPFLAAVTEAEARMQSVKHGQTVMVAGYCRRQGIGSRLCRHSLQTARWLGCVDALVLFQALMERPGA